MSNFKYPTPRLQRSHSTIMRKKWLDDYTYKIRETGETDIMSTRDRNLENVDLKTLGIDINKLKLGKTKCLIILPKQQNTTNNKNNNKNDNNKNNEEQKNDKNDKIEYEAFTLPLLKPTVGNYNIDIRQLYGRKRLTTYDPGFMSTSSCHSEITYIDGMGGRLLHRGYKIQDICDNSDFIELSFLLLYGELPSKEDRLEHETQIKKHTMVHEKLIEFFKGFRYNAHPMAIMCAVVGGLSSFYHDSMDIKDPDQRVLCAYRLIAKMPTLAAMAYKTSIGQPIMYPKNEYSYAGNFLHMMFALPTEPYKVNPILEKALDKFLMLHADHEQNASTSTVRIAGSSHANPFACIASGITALWGPAHGGANEAVLNMLEEIKTEDRIPLYIAKAKDKKDPFRLMGFGHRVYKNYDPRAKVMKKICDEILEKLDIKDPLLKLAQKLEQHALKDEYFIKRKLFPNVDFYSGIVLKAMGIPRSMYTVLFAVGRCVGWISHWKEMISDSKQRIGRPRQMYVGQKERTYVPIDRRKNNNKSNGDKE